MDTAPANHAHTGPGGALAILLRTEDGRVRAALTDAELEALLAGLGTAGNRYAVVDRAVIEDNVFIQAWRGDDGVYEVEHRAGSPAQHFTAKMTGPAQLAALIAAWARGESSWRAVDWQPIDLTSTRDAGDQTRAID
jgi:hypothetical protein